MIAALLAMVQAPCRDLDLSILPVKGSIKIGAMTEIIARVKNRSARPVTVVRQNVGFADHRSPNCRLECRRVGSDKWVEISLHPTCGNVDPISKSDFDLLKPGAHEDWKGYLYWTPALTAMLNQQAGKFELRFTYFTDKPIDAWLGGPQPDPQQTRQREDIRSAFEQVPKGEFVSRTARVRFEKGPS